MSDLENEYFLDESVNEDEDESVNEDDVDVELIRLVKVNPGLWDKNSKEYSNILEREMAWESVASLLPIEMTGTDAVKRFRTLRTTFGRYYKKVRESQPRSGAGSNWPIYQPNWPLYEELLFLIDVIKPRHTKSNTFAKSVLKPRTDQSNNRNIAVLGFNKRSSQQSQFSSSSAHTNSPKSQVYPSSSSACTNRSKSEMHFLSSEHTNSPMSEKHSYSSSVHANSAISQGHFSPTYSVQLQQNNTPSDVNEIYDSEERNLQKLDKVPHCNITESDIESKANCSRATYKRLTKKQIPRTPSPDSFFNKKKVKNDADMNNLDKLAKALVTMSQQMVTQPPIQSAQRQEEKEAANIYSEVESFMRIIKALLQRIRMQQRIQCLIDILNILKNFENKN